MVQFLPAFRIGMTVFGVLGAAIAIVFYDLLTRHPERAMVMFQLRPDDARRDFHLLLGMELVALIGLVPYLLGAVTENITVMNIGRGASGVIAVLLLVLFIRWGRRFR